MKELAYLLSRLRTIDATIMRAVVSVQVALRGETLSHSGFLVAASQVAYK